MASILYTQENYRRLQRHVPLIGVDGEQGDESPALAKDYGSYTIPVRFGK